MSWGLVLTYFFPVATRLFSSTVCVSPASPTLLLNLFFKYNTLLCQSYFLLLAKWYPEKQIEPQLARSINIPIMFL